MNWTLDGYNITDHLRKEHRIIISGRQEIRREATQTRLEDITAFMANETLAPAKKRKITAEEDALEATLHDTAAIASPLLISNILLFVILSALFV
jgi:hypothetical protein